MDPRRGDGALLAQAARDTLAAGPMSWTERREDHVRYLDETFGDGRALLSGIAATHPSSTCAVVVGMWAMLAGLQLKRRPPAAKAITTWAGFGGFTSRYWVPVAELVPEIGDCPYWCGDHPNGWQASGNGHVGALLEGDDWMWITAEGGGGADGTNCRMSAAPKDIRTHSGRKLRGVWRPGGRDTAVTPVPKSDPPPKPSPKPPAPPTVPSGLLRGIDVSSHQLPGSIDWKKLAETHRFIVVRATYGARLDTQCAEHIERAHAVGIVTGLYHFFRASQTVAHQIEAFEQVCEALKMGPGWIVPTLDVEQNEAFDGPTTAERYAPAEEFCRALKERWGSAMVYTNPATWHALSAPEWLREHVLWIAHHNVAYEKVKPPLGLAWTLWQCRVAPLPGVYAQDIDQNVARELPLLQDLANADTEPAPALIPLGFDEEEYRKNRDALIKEEG